MNIPHTSTTRSKTNVGLKKTSSILKKIKKGKKTVKRSNKKAGCRKNVQFCLKKSAGEKILKNNLFKIKLISQGKKFYSNKKFFWVFWDPIIWVIQPKIIFFSIGIFLEIKILPEKFLSIEFFFPIKNCLKFFFIILSKNRFRKLHRKDMQALKSQKNSSAKIWLSLHANTCEHYRESKNLLSRAKLPPKSKWSKNPKKKIFKEKK